MTNDLKIGTQKIPTDDNLNGFRAIQVDVPGNLEEIRVILFEPREPGNIGSVARAMKGMGLSKLYLVNPVPFREAKPAWYMAHGATDVIENCQVVDLLEEALEGIQFLVGTTHRKRGERLAPSVPARKAAQQIASISQSQKVAVLFGREDFGLSSRQISMCQLTASVPMATKNPSLNLAQAVQILAYEIFLASVTEMPTEEYEYAEVNQIEAFYGRITDLLKSVGVTPYNHDWETYLRSLRRVFSRTRLETRDIATLDMIFSTASRYIDRLQTKLKEQG
ncbi:MAG: RNA methyltransferase [Candidatus Poribacteria bacterium]|nr:RNA methyltransferase [Candidatus Poribacteria bacterium]MDE0503686.1 RNA methyltransferase [Candidatus Poribacteria bacterium]